MPLVLIEQCRGENNFSADAPFYDSTDRKGFTDTIKGKKVVIEDFTFIGKDGPIPSQVAVYSSEIGTRWVSNPVVLDPTFLKPRRLVIPVSIDVAREVEKDLLLLRNRPHPIISRTINNHIEGIFRSAELNLGIDPRKVPLLEKILDNTRIWSILK